MSGYASAIRPDSAAEAPPAYGPMIGTSVLDSGVSTGRSAWLERSDKRLCRKTVFRRAIQTADPPMSGRTPPGERQPSIARSIAPATTSADAAIRRIVSCRSRPSPSRIVPQPDARTIADSRNGATAVSGATLNAARMRR